MTEESLPANPFLDNVDWENPTTFGGIDLTNTKYPFGTTVRRLAPVADDKEKRMRFQVVLPDGTDADIYTVGDDIATLLTPELTAMFDETVDRVHQYFEMYFAATQAFQETIVARELLSQAMVENVPADQVKASGFEDFRCNVFNGQLEILAGEMGHIQAKLDWLQKYIEAAFITVSHNVRSWFGCMLPVGILTQPQSDRTIKVSIEVAAVPVTADGSVLDYALGLDCRWSSIMFTAAVFKEMVGTKSYQEQFVRVMSGGSASGLILT